MGRDLKAVIERLEAEGTTFYLLISDELSIAAAVSRLLARYVFKS